MPCCMRKNSITDKKYFAGIGSRDIPKKHYNLLIDASLYLSRKGYILRSGGASGSDIACEIGVDYNNGEKEIYIPWKGFNDNKSILFPENLENWCKASKIAAEFHPNWNNLKDSVKKLHARNCYQILGKDLTTPVKFVLCYCKVENGEYKGGTSQALRIALYCKIPIINIWLEEDFKKVEDKINKKC